MAAEPHVAQGYLYSQIEEAVNTGFRESGLVRKVDSTGSGVLSNGLKGYVVIMLGAFMRIDTMYVRYQTERAKFAALVGDYYFDAVLGQIHAGDLALFHGGLFFGGVYRQEEAADAQKAYNDVAVLLRGNRSEHGFFVFLSHNALRVMESLELAAVHLNLPQPKDAKVLLPAVERYLGRN